MRRAIIMGISLLWSSGVLAGVGGPEYTIGTSNSCDNALDISLLTGGAHEGQTKQQVVQRWVTADCNNLKAQIDAARAALFNEKYQVASNPSKSNAEDALLLGIAAPTIGVIADQSGTVGDTIVAIPIVAADPDSLPLRIVGTNLPPGIQITAANIAPGGPQLTGTLTNPGTYAVVLRACKFRDCSIFAEESLTWTVVPAP